MPTIDDLNAFLDDQHPTAQGAHMRPCPHPMSDATPEPKPVEKVAFECYQTVYNVSRLVKQLATAKDIAETEADVCLEAIGALLSPCADTLLELSSVLSAAERACPRAPGRARKKGGGR
jgi:hypothetical protein